MKRFWRRVMHDLRNLNNIEIYMVSALALLLAFLTIAGEVVENLQISQSIINGVILSALFVLVLHLSIPETGSGRLDDFLDDRTDLGSFAERIEGAEHLSIYAPSATNIINNNVAAIRTHILQKKSGEVRVVIQDPKREDAMRILIDQLDESVDYQVQHLPEEIERTMRQFELIEAWDVDGKFSYQLLDYSPGFSLVMIDPHKNNGQIIVEFHGLGNEATESRMHLVLTKRKSERWFVYWQGQFEQIWNRSRPPL